jgi:hypothetical protein
MASIETLLSTLEDPFNLFPLESASRQVSSLVSSANELLSSRAGWWGGSPRYRSVEDEHALEVVRLLVGSTFVLGQAAITQTVSIVSKIRELAGCAPWLPAGKTALMNTEAVIHTATGLSEIVLFDAVANYVKHHYEWPKNWSGASVGIQQRTIDAVVRLGFVPDSEENLDVALKSLGISAEDMSPLGRNIQGWRERLAASFRIRMAESDPV